MYFWMLVFIAALVYLVRTLLSIDTKPMNRKRQARLKSYVNKKKKYEMMLKIQRIKDITLRQLMRIGMPEYVRQEYKYYIDRLGLKKTPEEVRAEQLLYTIIAIIITILVFQVNKMLAGICVLGVFLAWQIPVDQLTSKVKEKNENIMKDFPSFYSLVYYQYARDNRVYLDEVIRNFLPNANKDMAEELEILLDDLETGELYALNRFKNRVRLPYVLRFCDVMQTRLQGYNNVAQMSYLKEELQQLRLKQLDVELDRRKKKNDIAQFSLVLLIAIYVLIYYYFNFMEGVSLFM